jgi:hypothetical protein
VEQRLRVGRQAHDRNRCGELPDRGGPAGRARRPPTSNRRSGPPRGSVGQRTDAGGRTAGLCGGERAAKAIQADTAQCLGPALRPARRGSSRRRRRHEDPTARGGAQDGRRRLLRAACAAAEGQPPGPPPTARWPRS